LEVGQRVRLQAGPLAGVEGILVAAGKQERVVVSITLLRRSVAVAMERDWAIPVDSAGREIPLQFRFTRYPSSPVPSIS
jgi:hypothetical protein